MQVILCFDIVSVSTEVVYHTEHLLFGEFFETGLAGNEAERYSTCLASMRPRVQLPAMQKEKEVQNNVCEIKLELQLS